jgi:tetratricopeptide (TPR) repeat protein
MRRLLAGAALLLAAAAPEPTPPAALHSATDRLLAELKAAPDPQAAGALETKLQTVWQDQATPSVQILLDHATQQAQAGKLDDALADADAALTLQPDAAEVWRRRAEIRFAAGDDRGAFGDLAQALTREPRFIAAWADLSRFAEARHDPKRALAAWRKLLELDPKTDGGQKRLERLQHLVNGQPI